MKVQSTYPPKYNNLRRYYRLHARFYDATRWAFLFGRHSLVNRLPDLPPGSNIVEVGCGTGFLLKQLTRHFPNARITGIDVAEDMLEKANIRLGADSNIELLHQPYGLDEAMCKDVDMMLFSYALTMMGDQFIPVLDQAYRDLKPGGWIGVVDFHKAGFPLFNRWMRHNHVVMEGQVLEALNWRFAPHQSTIKKAYGGLWQYLTYLGRRQVIL